MADIIGVLFRNRKVNLNKLPPFGFERAGDGYCYREILKDSGFQMTVFVTASGDVSARVIDPATQSPYTLHLVDGAVGSFVGGVRTAYEELLERIAAQCFEPNVFKSDQARALIAYARDAYGDELAFLWQKFPDNAVWRRKDTAKWYGALLTIPKSKLGLDGSGMIEILDLRARPEDLKTLIDGRNYFPGYHMNKQNWFTTPLDDSIPDEELRARLDQSYRLAVK